VIVEAGSAVTELTDELAVTPLKTDEVLRVATTTLSRIRPGTWIAQIMNRDPTTSQVFAADNGDPRLLAYLERFMSSLVERGTVPTDGMPRTVIESGEPIVFPLGAWDEYAKGMTPPAREWFGQHVAPTALRTISTIIAPLRALGHTIGILQYIAWNSDQPLTDHDVAWMQAIADRLGLLADHALTREASETRLDRLSATRNVAMAVAASQDLRLTLQLILEQTTARLEVDAADVLLVDDAGVELYVGAALGFRSMLPQDLKVPIPPDLTEASLLGRRFDRRYDARTDPDWTGQFRRRALFNREGFKSYRAVSLLVQGRLMGMLEVFHRSAVDVDQEWLWFLEAMGTHAAIAVRNAALLEEVARSGGQRAATQRPELSSLEWRILALVAEGATNREIAGTVHLSENTIKFHIRRLLDRLGAVNRTDLARKATQNSWL
jgi:DNA-binding CsgD family transcriptional regulator